MLSALSNIASSVKELVTPETRGNVGTLSLNGKQLAVNTSQYPGIHRVGEGELYLNAQCVKVEGGKLSFKNAEDAQEFSLIHDRWQSNELRLPRGVSSNHFSWNDIREGQAKSEGTADKPTYTMSDRPQRVDEKTCWLPTAGLSPVVFNGSGQKVLAEGEASQQIALGVAQGNMSRDMGDAVRNGKPDLLLGAILEFKAGKDSGNAICFLNAGETAIKGPIGAKDFDVKLVVSPQDPSQPCTTLDYKGDLRKLPGAGLYDANIADKGTAEYSKLSDREKTHIDEGSRFVRDLRERSQLSRPASPGLVNLDQVDSLGQLADLKDAGLLTPDRILGQGHGTLENLTDNVAMKSINVLRRNPTAANAATELDRLQQHYNGHPQAAAFQPLLDQLSKDVRPT
jgi:hypothetical protein